MTVSVVRSRRAEQHIRAIVDYLAEYSEPAAERFVDALSTAERQLSEYPYSGEAGIRPGSRRLVVGSYIISYRVKGGTAQIFAIRDARRGDARP